MSSRNLGHPPPVTPVPPAPAPGGAPPPREFAALLERAFLSRGDERAAILAALARQLTQAGQAGPLVRMLLDRCAAFRSEDGLDVGTAVLARCGPLALRFARDFLKQDRPRWATETDITYHPADDFWTILIRAAVGQEDSRDECLALLRECLPARNRGLREAVVDGLHDLATPAARDLLAGLVHDPDPLIARLAREAVSDFEGR